MAAPGFLEADGRNMSRATVLMLMAPFFALVIFAFLYPLANLLSISVLEPQPTLEHYQRVAENPVYARVLFRTLQIALLVSLLSLALSLPVAVLMASSRGPKAIFLTACILLPFWSSVLVRTLPIYGALRNIPADYSRAAAICGAGPLRTFWEVTLPLAMPGIIGGFILVFLTALGYFITPALLGSPQEMMIATLISQQMRENLDWPFAAALVGVLTLIVTVITIAFSKVFRFERMLGGRA